MCSPWTVSSAAAASKQQRYGQCQCVGLVIESTAKQMHTDEAVVGGEGVVAIVPKDIDETRFVQKIFS